ncbi:MAG: SDR family oxidoreductase [Chitinophagales bacterium]|jgi:3-oxoacyl-[acyl-carrier protein] reductase|nr:SDR family oxidoreductase [Chitinophagales bacterium]
MNLSLIGKNALVSGSTQGIGKAIAIELALLGANVTLLARNENALIENVKDLDISKGQTHHFAVADFSDTTSVLQAANQITAERNIHILINNSGGPTAGPITGESAEKFLAIFNQHLICNQILAQAVLKGMKEDAYGRIINVISTSVKQPLKNLGVSNTIRGAVASWAKTWSFEVAPFGITVNNVLPGATATNRLKTLIEIKSDKTNHSIDAIEAEMLHEIPARRFGDPSEIASLAAFLASPAAGYINGTSIPVDGGRTAAI